MYGKNNIINPMITLQFEKKSEVFFYLTLSGIIDRNECKFCLAVFESRNKFIHTIEAYGFSIWLILLAGKITVRTNWP
jgi:hypothetical protein